jgi:hypothetical protein
MYHFREKHSLSDSSGEITGNGIPISYDLVPANTDERVAAEGVLEMIQHSEIYADKGFISADWQATIARRTGKTRR